MRLKADLILFAAAVFWGSAFSAQRVAAQHLDPFFFNGSRFLLGALVLFLLRRGRWKLERQTLRWTVLAGSLLFIASALQQAGLRWTTAANAGFLTGLYVVFIPLIMVLVWREQVSWHTWTAVLLAAGGAWLLSAPGALHLAPGDGLEVAGAVVWALHVILVGKVANNVDTLEFAGGQFLVCGVLNLLVSAASGLPALESISQAWWTIVYTGLFSIAIGYTLQVVGQRHSPPFDAALILSLEAVFAALFGWLFLAEGLSGVQLTGCALIMAAIILVQVRVLQNERRQQQLIN